MRQTKPVIKTEVIPYVFYRDVPAALEWLARFRVRRRNAARDGERHARTDDNRRPANHDGTRQQGFANAKPERNQDAEADQFAPGRGSGCASRCAEPTDRQRPLSILAAHPEFCPA